MGHGLLEQKQETKIIPHKKLVSKDLLFLTGVVWFFLFSHPLETTFLKRNFTKTCLLKILCLLKQEAHFYFFLRFAVDMEDVT